MWSGYSPFIHNTAVNKLQLNVDNKKIQRSFPRIFSKSLVTKGLPFKHPHTGVLFHPFCNQILW